MTRGGARTAKARSLILADHAARCTCQGRAPCADGDELRRVLLRELDAGAGLADALTAFNLALRAELGARGLVPEDKTTTTRRRRPSEA